MSIKNTDLKVSLLAKQKNPPEESSGFLLKVNSKLNVQIFYVQRVVFDKLAARFDLIAH